MASRLDIYNQALLRLGERRLATLADNRPERRSLDAVWADTLAYMIEAGMWNFASRTEELQASETVVPTFGYTYAFEKPEDYVRIVAIADNELLGPTLDDFLEEGDYFYAWQEPLYLQYISNDTSYGADPGKWTASFSRAFTLELAYRIAPQIGASTELQKHLYEEKDRCLKNAKTKDAVNQSMRRLPAGRLAQARIGMGFYRDPTGTPPWRR
jgi:hypothetical protein